MAAPSDQKTAVSSIGDVDQTTLRTMSAVSPLSSVSGPPTYHGHYEPAPPPSYQATRAYTVLYVPSLGSHTPGYHKVVQGDRLIFRVDTLENHFLGAGSRMKVKAPCVPMNAKIENTDPSIHEDAYFGVVASAEVGAKDIKIAFGPEGKSPLQPVERSKFGTKKLLIKSASAFEAFTFDASGKNWTWRPKPRSLAGWNTPDHRSVTKGMDKQALELFAPDAPSLEASTPSKEHKTSDQPSPDAKMAYIHWSPLPGAPLPPQPQSWRIGQPVAELHVYHDVDEEVLTGALLVAMALDEKETGNHSKEAW